MAVSTQILLAVYRDKNASFNPLAGKQGYYLPGTTTVSSVGRSFNISTIKNVRNVTEDSVTFGCITYHETDGAPREDILTIETSGTIISRLNA